jgi:hypothetical protein
VSASAIGMVVLLVALPGLGAVLAVFPPGRVSLPTAIALTFALGYTVTALTYTGLAVCHIMGPAASLASAVIVTAALWAAALRRHGLRAHAVEMRRRTRTDAVANALGVGLLVIFAAVRYHSYSPLLNYDVAAGWRYWADGLIIAHNGHVPARTPGWGSTYPTTVSKVVLNSFLAGLSYHVSPLAGMTAGLWVSAVGLFAGLWALARELGLRVAAPLVPVLLVAVPPHVPLNPEMTNDLEVFTAENLGRMVGVAALIVGIHALRERARLNACVAGLMLLAAAGTHLIPAAIAAGLLVVYALAYALSAHAVRRSLLVVGVVLAITLVGWAVIVSAAGGQLGFGRVGGASGAAGFPKAFDPARSFLVGKPVYVPGRASKPYYYLPRTILNAYVGTAVGSNTRRPPGWAYALLAVAAAAALLLVVFRRFELSPVGAMALMLGAAIVAVALAFDYRYSTMVPADFGLHRLYDYNAIPLVFAGAGVVEVACRRLAGWKRVRLVPVAVAAALALAAILSVQPSRVTTTAAAAEGIFAAVRADVPCDGRILADARTAGSFATLTGREGIVEGMAPYLNTPVMHQVLPVLFGARRFFTDPAQNVAFLRREHVDYVLLLTDQDVRIGQSGGGLGAHVDEAGLRSLPQLHPVASGPAFELYSVGAASPPNGRTTGCSQAVS